MYIKLSRRKERKGFLKQNDEKLRDAIAYYHSSLWCYFQILDFYCTLSLLGKSRLVLILVRNSLEVGCIILNNQQTKKWNKNEILWSICKWVKNSFNCQIFSCDPIYNLFQYLIPIEKHDIQLNLEYPLELHCSSPLFLPLPPFPTFGCKWSRV